MCVFSVVPGVPLLSFTGPAFCVHMFRPTAPITAVTTRYPTYTCWSVCFFPLYVRGVNVLARSTTAGIRIALLFTVPTCPARREGSSVAVREQPEVTHLLPHPALDELMLSPQFRRLLHLRQLVKKERFVSVARTYVRPSQALQGALPEPLTNACRREAPYRSNVFQLSSAFTKPNTLGFILAPAEALSSVCRKMTSFSRNE